MIGGFFKKGTILFITGNAADDNGATEYVYNMNDNTIASTDIDIQSRKDFPMALITNSNGIYVVSCMKSSSIISIRSITGWKETSIDTFSINTNTYPYLFDQTFYETMIGNETNSNFINFGYVSPAQTESAEILNKDCKMYYENDSIYITVNGPVKDVVLISFSLTHPQAIYRKIITAQPACKNPDVYSVHFNSYLLDNHLYAVSACSEQLQFEGYDINTGAQQFIKTTKPDEPIVYANTPIVQSVTDNMTGSGNNRIIDDTKQLIRKMMDGNVIVTVQENSHDIRSLIGSYKEFKPVRGFTAMPLPGLGAVLSLTGLALRNATPLNSASRITSFSSVLDKRTYAHKQGLSELSLRDKIDSFKQNVSTYYTCESIYQMNGNDMYLYYNVNTKALTMAEF